VNERHEALRTLLMLRKGAELHTEYDVSEMAFVIEYLETDLDTEALFDTVQFVVSARTWDGAMGEAEAAAVRYIAKVTS